MLQSQNGTLPAEGMTWNGSERLNVLEAMLAHIRVNKQLLDYIARSPEERLDPETVRRDSECALGQWILGIGGIVYGEKKLFQELMSLHADFHAQAAKIVSAVNRGESKCARNLLQGRYAKTSRRFNVLLAKISLEFGFDE